MSVNGPSMKDQQSINGFCSFTFGNQRAALSHTSRENVLGGVIARKASGTLIAAS